MGPNVLNQGFNLVATPVVFYFGLYSWGGARAILGESFAAGTMAAMCVPTTTNTGVLFTQQVSRCSPVIRCSTCKRCEWGGYDHMT